MLISWLHNLDSNVVVDTSFRRLTLVLAATLACQTAIASDGLWVENPEEVAFAVADMTHTAREMGLTDAGFAATLKTKLKRAGLTSRESDIERDRDVLFLDIIVEDETFYASLGFRRTASYRLPTGKLNSELVTVWQDYSVGSHHDDPGTIRETVNKIIERFIVKYTEANKVGAAFQVASAP